MKLTMQPPMSRRPRGFTLVEGVAVIVVIGILSVTTMILFDYKSLDTSTFGDQLQAQVSYAQKVAIAQRTTVYVVISGSTSDICYDSGCSSKVSSPSGAANFTLTAPSSDVTITAGTGTFSFNALGKPSFSSTRTITTSGSGTRSFSIEPETGYVHR